MLEEQYSWYDYSHKNQLAVEIDQLRDEGKDTAAVEAVMKKAEGASREEKEKLLKEIELLIENTGAYKSYPYVEPSDYQSIEKECPQRKIVLENKLSAQALKDKIAGAWYGRVSGCLLGKPIEGYTREKIKKILSALNTPHLTKYIALKDFTEEQIKDIEMDKSACWADNLNGASPADDDTNYTVLALRLVEKYGKDFRPDDVLDAWLSWLPIFYTCTAERVAYSNAANCITAPLSATYRNPYREWIGAQIRADFYGYINPGKCKQAAHLAFKDSSVSHVKNGIYGSMFVAAMIAAAAVCDDIPAIIEAALQEIPQKCRLKERVNMVLDWYKAGKDWDFALSEIHRIYDEKRRHDWCHAVSNTVIVVSALLFGNKDYSSTICYAAEAGFDTDCNAATAGSVLGMMIGLKNIPAQWTAPYNGKLFTALAEYSPVYIDDMVERTLKLID